MASSWWMRTVGLDMFRMAACSIEICWPSIGKLLIGLTYVFH